MGVRLNSRLVLLCVTASHKTAGFELLERLSVHTTDVAPLIAAHDECVRGAVVVATCNRFEAYLEMDEPVTAAGAVGVEATLAAVEAATGVRAAEVDGSYEVLTGPTVAEHLFAVASGLESVVVGEGEIAGQVRRALKDARAHGTASTELERLFQRASEAQRGVKSATALGRAGRSLVRLALELADSRVADWSALRVLLVGTGAYAGATLAALRVQGAHDISVYSPSGRAERFATKHGLAWVDAEDYPIAAADADLIITCTTVEHHVLDADVLRTGERRRGDLGHDALGHGGLGHDGLGHASAVARPASACPVAPARPRRLVIDLGLPRNVDPDVATLPDVDVLDLETIRLHAPLEELQATAEARRIVGEAAQRFTVVGEAQAAAPAVVALREHVFGLLEDEIGRLHTRGDDGSGEQALRHLVGRLLHTPTVRAQELATQGRLDEYVRALETLFAIEVLPAATAAPRSALGDRRPASA